jgi:hypothetical protein
MRRVSGVRTKIGCYLSREVGISMAEMARRLEVGTSAIAMAIILVYGPVTFYSRILEKGVYYKRK